MYLKKDFGFGVNAVYTRIPDSSYSTGSSASMETTSNQLGVELMGMVRNIKFFAKDDVYLSAGIARDLGSKVTYNGALQNLDSFYIPLRFGLIHNITRNTYLMGEISKLIPFGGKNYVADKYSVSLGVMVLL